MLFEVADIFINRSIHFKPFKFYQVIFINIPIEL
jgi:hypothetical protein